MHLYEVTVRIRDALEIFHNGYYSDRSNDYKLGVMTERLERLLEEIDAALEKEKEPDDSETCEPIL